MPILDLGPTAHRTIMYICRLHFEANVNHEKRHIFSFVPRILEATSWQVDATVVLRVTYREKSTRSMAWFGGAPATGVIGLRDVVWCIVVG